MPKPDWTSGAQGAIQGGTTGFQAGGPVGGVIGAITGGTLGLFGGGKKKKKAKRQSTLDERQQRLNEQQHQSILGEGPLADLYNYDPQAANNVFDQTVANPAYRKFKEDLAPQITGQFRSQGLMNSSYAGDALSRIARDIQEGLDAQRAKYMYGEQSDARNAKRNAVENLQNRQTFALDTVAPTGGNGFDIGSILGSITPEQISGAKGMFNRAPQSQSLSRGAPANNSFSLADFGTAR